MTYLAFAQEHADQVAWYQNRAKRLRELADAIGVRLGSGNYLEDAGELDWLCAKQGFVLIDRPPITETHRVPIDGSIVIKT